MYLERPRMTASNVLYLGVLGRIWQCKFFWIFHTIVLVRSDGKVWYQGLFLDARCVNRADRRRCFPYPSDRTIGGFIEYFLNRIDESLNVLTTYIRQNAIPELSLTRIECLPVDTTARLLPISGEIFASLNRTYGTLQCQCAFHHEYTMGADMFAMNQHTATQHVEAIQGCSAYREYKNLD